MMQMVRYSMNNINKESRLINLVNEMILIITYLIEHILLNMDLW